MSVTNIAGFQQDCHENVVEISELIKLTLDLTGLIHRRFRMYGYYQQAQAVADIRRLLAQMFDMDLFPDDTFAKFLAGAFDGEAEDGI